MARIWRTLFDGAVRRGQHGSLARGASTSLRNLSSVMSQRFIAIIATLCVALWAGRWVSVTADESVGSARTSVAVLAAEARFETNVSKLSVGGQAGLSKLVSALQAYQQILSIRVVGHTDSVGAADYNRRLSAQRALTISRFLQVRLPTVQILAVGAGEATPIANNATVEGRDRNRRVEVHVVATAVKQASR